MAIHLRPRITQDPSTSSATDVLHAVSSVDSPSSNETLLERIENLIKRFVFLQSDQLYHLIAIWTLATHLYPSFEYFPYLFISSPEPGSGKSILLDVLDRLVFNSSGVLIDPTKAILFRTACNSTQILDEIDTWQDGDSLRGVLNAGFHRGGIVKRNVKGEAQQLQIVVFKVYCPRALAGINERRILHPATVSRTLRIRMAKQKKSERRERLKGKGNAFSAVKTEIEQWVKENAAAVKARYEGGEFQYLEGFSDRTIDITEPLAAVHEILYGDHPQEDDRRCTLIEGIAEACQEKNESMSDLPIFEELVWLAESNPDRILIGSASELAAKCNELPNPPTEYDVSRALRRHGFATKSIRLHGEDPKYRYKLSADTLVDIVVRYGDHSQSEPAL